MLPLDLREQLDWLARDLGTSVAALLRWGAMLVLEECGETLPESVADRRRLSFGGEAPRYANEIVPERLRVAFDDHLYRALERRAGKEGVAGLVYELVKGQLPPERPGAPGHGLN